MSVLAEVGASKVVIGDRSNGGGQTKEQQEVQLKAHKTKAGVKVISCIIYPDSFVFIQWSDETLNSWRRLNYLPFTLKPAGM